ncbi:MAG: DUF1667 domain-containing protein [Oscillospiraceae bacterium]|nr:DUF1667 domain-containing protein [Oscillospiraceae bacterium]
MIKELTCVACPLGCPLVATIENGEVVDVKGNTCKRGAEYAKTECTHPVRSLTTTAKVNGGSSYVVPVKSSVAMPKEKLFEAMKVINSTTIDAPVHIGDVVVSNILGLDVDIIATNEVK